MHLGFPCLPLVKERFFLMVVSKKPDYRIPEVSMYMFPQVWGSTALGFEGIGGCALTTAYTVVVCDEENKLYGVFFDERPAYLVENPSEVFFEDLKIGRAHV